MRSRVRPLKATGSGKYRAAPARIEPMQSVFRSVTKEIAVPWGSGALSSASTVAPVLPRNESGPSSARQPGAARPSARGREAIEQPNVESE